MKQMFRKVLSGFLSLAIIISLMPAIFTGWVDTAQAAVFTAMSDTMTRLKASTTADHTVLFTLPTGINFDITGNADYLRVDFDHTGGDAAFTQSGTWVTGDFTFNDGTARTVNAVAQGAGTITGTCTDGANNVGVAIDTTNHIFTIYPCGASFNASGLAATITFTILGTAGDGTLTNPVTAGSYKTDLAMCDEAADCATFGTSSHTGSVAVSIITDDQVVVSATVDPTITVTLSANTVNLGTLSTGSVSTATMTVQTATNAVNGYSATVLDDGNLRNGANDINDVGDGAVTAGAEEYGLGTSDNGQTISEDDDCNGTPSSAITTSAQTFAGAASGPADETITLCFAASITGTTVAAVYSHTLTIVSSGLF